MSLQDKYLEEMKESGRAKPASIRFLYTKNGAFDKRCFNKGRGSKGTFITQVSLKQ